jgi:hypothetical protein
MRRAIYAAVALLAGAAFASLASADAVGDPLHGACPGCAPVTINGDAVTLLGPGGVVGFGFTSSPPDASGDLVLKFLIPDNFSIDQVNAFIAGVTVTGTNQPVGGTSLSLFTSATFGNTWTASDGVGLEAFLGLNASPPNPLDAWLGATQFFQPTADGYYVLLADVGQFTLGGQSDPLADIFALSPAFFPQGGLIAANLFTADGVISTAQSSALLFGGPSSGPFCLEPPCGTPFAVPGPVVGAGIPGLVAACLTMLGLRNWRRRRHGDLA